MNNKRLFNKFLCFGMSCLVASSSFMPGISANSATKTDVVKIQNPESEKKSEPGLLKGFVDNHPKLTIGLMALGAYTAGKTGYKIGETGYKVGKIGYDLAYAQYHFRQMRKEFDASKIPTAIDGLNDEQISDQIAEEVEKYKGREPRVFKIEDKLITESDKRLFLLTIKQLNYLFDKYSGFTERLIDYKLNKAEDHEFLLRSTSFADDGISMGVDARVEIDLGGIALGGLKGDYNRFFFYADQVVKRHIASRRDRNKLVEGTITHEFGHVMEALYAIEKLNLKLPKIRGMWLVGNFMLIACGYGDPALEDNARLLFDIAAKIVGKENTGEELIDLSQYAYFSRIGAKAPNEFFAEAVAHLDCCSDVGEIGKNTEKFLVYEAKYLPPEKSKFHSSEALVPSIPL